MTLFCQYELHLGKNAAVGGGFARNLVFANMNLCNGYGLEEQGHIYHIQLHVMHKGRLYNKDRFTMDKQVACWHHDQYKLCSVLSLSLHADRHYEICAWYIGQALTSSM
jgi:hypothetical protein